MVRRWLLLGIAGALIATGCSKPEEDPKGGEGDACTVDADCESDLACRDSLCVLRAIDPDMGGGGDGGPNNGAPDGGDNNGENNGTVEDEDYVLSYILDDGNGARTMWLYDSVTGEHTKVSPDNVDCRLGCWVSDDLATFVTARANGPAFDILTAPMESDFTVTATPTPAVEAVRRVEVVGNIVTYVREDAGENKAFYKPLAGGPETLVGIIGDVVATEGDWAIDPVSEKAVVYRATLQTMDVLVADLGTEVSGDPAFTIDSTNYQQTSGSYFGGNIPTAFSPDGKYMALVTQKAPMDYNKCDTGDQCTEAGQRCGRFGRCSRIEVVVHFFGLDEESLANLGGPCSADSSCGPVHRCDIPAEDAVDEAVCVPRRVVLGLPADQMQEGETGCALTENNDDLKYTSVRSPLSFTPGGDLYFVAARNCGDQDTEVTDILSLSPTSDEVRVAYGMGTEPFDPDKCWSEAEQAVDITNCNPYIERATLSPGGNVLAFIGTNPNVADPSLAQSNVDVWSVLRNGEDHEWIGQHRELDVVKTIQMHPHP